MKKKDLSRNYAACRQRALTKLAKMHPRQYRQLMEAELGEPLRKPGRPKGR